MDKIDLYGGSVEVSFLPANGPTKSLSNIFYDESLKGTEFSSTAFNPKSVHFIQHVSVKVSLLRFTEIEITFAPPFEQAVKLLNSGVLGLGFSTKQTAGTKEKTDPELATEGLSTIGFNQVSVRMHYGGMSSNYFKGFLLAPEIEIGTDGISIKIRATGLLFPQAKKHSNKVLKDKTRIEIIKSLLGDGEDFEVKFDPNDAAAAKFMDTVHSVTAADSNWSLVKSLLDSSNCAIYDTGSESIEGIPTYEIISKDFLRTRDDNIYNFVLWENINPNERRFPILDLKTSIANYMMGQSLGINTATLDLKDKKVAPHEKVDFASVYSTSDGSQSGAPNAKDTPKDNDVAGNTKKIPLASEKDKKQPSMKEKALGLIQNATDKALQYQITTVGLMELRPGRGVGISVAGVAFLSGHYDLYEVTHEFSTDGVTTSLTLARTAGLASIIDRGVGIAQKKVSAALGGVRNVVSSKNGVVN